MKFPAHKQKDSDTAQRRISRKPDKRRVRSGSYSTFLTVIVLASAVVLNLLAAELPVQYTQFDLSTQKLYTLRSQTEDLAASLDKDVTLYYIVQDSSRDETVSRLLERYEDLSSHISVVEKDPVLSPNFTSQYTDETLSDNSVIAVCGENSRVVPYDDMYEQEFNYNYYSYETTGFDAEGQITSALAAVTSEDLPVLCRLTGHGEAELDSSVTSLIEKQNIRMEDLNLLTSDQIPEDTDCLLILSPASDLSEAETDKVLDYLRTGGSAVIFTDYSEQETPNLDAILAWYGVSRAEGVVIEGDGNHFIQVPYYLVPDIKSTDYTADMADGSSYVLLAAAQGLTADDSLRDTLSASELLSTSDSAYSKTDVAGMSTYSKEDGDIDGPFSLGVVVTEDVELTDDLLAEVAESPESSELNTVVPAGLGNLENAEEPADSELKDSGLTEKENTGSDTESMSEAESEDVTENAAEDTSEAESGDSTENAAEDISEAVTESAAEDTSEAVTESAAEDTSEAESGDSTENLSGTDPDTAKGTAENAAAPETVQTNLAVFSSSSLLDPGANQMVAGGNLKLFQNILSRFCGNEINISIPSRSLSLEYLTVTSQAGSMWSILVTGIIPGAFLLYGLFVWYRRRRQ